MSARSRLLSLIAVVAFGFGQSAAATTVHPTYTGPQVDFTLIQETTQTPAFGPADVEPLFGAPTGVGNSLQFFPTVFSAVGGAGTLDDTHSLLQVQMESVNPLTDTLEIINITEFGDALISGVGGTAATAIFLRMSGTITFTETTAGVINETFNWYGTFNVGMPAGSGAVFFDYTTNFGNTNWTGTASIDTAALLATKGIFDGATKATLTYNDQIQAYSQATTSATVNKKAATGPGVIIEVIPEPATGLLLAGGMIALGIRSRRTRA